MLWVEAGPQSHIDRGHNHPDRAAHACKTISALMRAQAPRVRVLRRLESVLSCKGG